jgi:hypothetical protein
VSVESSGRIDDLFDFNYDSGGLPQLAATVQLGYSTRSPVGRIFKTAVDFSRVWNLSQGNPCPE